ncbi:MAG TPA: hypothetical protein VGI81_08765 [Tepidisphaeraceae bacterium]|jgi:hypothetical protein
MIELPAGERRLDVCVRGTAHAETRMELELWLTDTDDVTLAFFSAAHAQGVTPLWPAGPFELRRSRRLPATTHRGEYFLNLSLTHHNVCGWMDCYRAVRLHAEGTPTATGRPLEYREGKGLFTLEEAPEASAGATA